MDTALIVSEIAFYTTVSVAIVVMSVFFGCMIYRLIRVIREFESFFHKLNQASSEVGEWLTKSSDTLSELPILSRFFKRQVPREARKVKEKSAKTTT